MEKIMSISLLLFLIVLFSASINAIEIPDGIVSDDTTVVSIGDRFILPSKYLYEYVGSDPLTASDPKIRIKLVGLLQDDGTIYEDISDAGRIFEEEINHAANPDILYQGIVNNDDDVAKGLFYLGTGWRTTFVSVSDPTISDFDIKLDLDTDGCIDCKGIEFTGTVEILDTDSNGNLREPLQILNVKTKFNQDAFCKTYIVSESGSERLIKELGCTNRIEDHGLSPGEWRVKLIAKNRGSSQTITIFSDWFELLLESGCTDSDGGKDYYTKGKVFSHLYDIYGGFKEDSCSGNRVIEYYCDGDDPDSRSVVCENGCKDGVCKLNEEEKSFDLSQYPYPFVENDNFNTITVVSQYANSEAVIGAADILQSIENIVPVGPIIQDIDVYPIYGLNYASIDKNIISIGGGCANRITNDILGNPINCVDIDPNTAVIKLFGTSQGKAAIAVYGYTGADTRMAAHVLANYNRWQDAGLLKGTEVLVTGTGLTDIKLKVLKTGKIQRVTPPPIDAEIIEEFPDVEEIEIPLEEPEDIDEEETEYFDEIRETREPRITPQIPIQVEPDECEANADCDDKNACTSNTCSGTPKKCSYVEVSLGCNYNGNCLPIGVRTQEDYCDIDRNVKSQLGADEECSNDYECSSNVCVNNQCISQNLIQKILSWFSRFFG